MKTICVIPARYASSRLPGKVIAPIAGKPMIQWVYEKAKQARGIDRVIVATDHTDVKTCVESFSGEVRMTRPELPSGTDRVYAAIADEQADIIINLQGDEPFVSPHLLTELVKVFQDPAISIATPICRIDSVEDIKDPNIVGVVRDANNYALYFSRSAIPFIREEQELSKWTSRHTFYKHIGIYAYRKPTLKQLVTLNEGKLEKAERLEQLRFLENGFKIYTLETKYNSISVDTEQDLVEVNSLALKQLDATQK